MGSASKKLIINTLHLRHHFGDFFAKPLEIRPKRPRRPCSLGLGSEILKRARLVLMFLRLELNSRAKFNPAGASVRTEGVLVGSKKAIPAWSLTATAQKLTIGYADGVGLN